MIFYEIAVIALSLAVIGQQRTITRLNKDKRQDNLADKNGLDSAFAQVRIPRSVDIHRDKR